MKDRNPKRIIASSLLTITVSMTAAPLMPVGSYALSRPAPIMAPVTESVGEDSRVYFTDTDVMFLCRCVYAEARGLTLTEQSQVVWCVLNRLDDGGFGDTITDVVTAPHQFACSGGDKAVEWYEWLVRDVLTRWVGEQKGDTDPEKSGRTLPPEYKYFWGDGRHNHFTDAWKNGNEYDGSLGTPYESEDD